MGAVRFYARDSHLDSKISGGKIGARRLCIIVLQVNVIFSNNKSKEGLLTPKNSIYYKFPRNHQKEIFNSLVY